MEKTIFAVALLVFASSAFSAVVDWGGLDCKKRTYQGVYFKDAKIALPQNLVDLLNGERVDLVVSQAGSLGTVKLSGKVDGGVLYELGCEERADATFRVSTSGPVIERISSSESPMKEFKTAREKGEIAIDPISGVAFMKSFFLSIVMLFY
ncbi:MAG: hypothetical protein QW568_04850 [Candidatus Anstonellaceae archaeon]